MSLISLGKKVCCFEHTGLSLICVRVNLTVIENTVIGFLRVSVNIFSSHSLRSFLF